MKKCLCYLLVLSFIFIYGSASAQNDSAYFDLGRVKLRKDFTQHVTIKGSDLGHMQFARVSDAIGPWLQGTLNNRHTLVFVVDGNLVNDVDFWSIQDIEEITLIQNAATQLNGSEQNQQLVLVTTKRKQPASKGLVVTGNSSRVNYNHKAARTGPSENNYYHQYHVGAWQNSGRFSYGASANWLRDVSPAEEDLFKTDKPYQMNRFRFNGFVDATIAEGHLLTLRLNVAPQTVTQDRTYTGTLYTSDLESKAKNTSINPSLRLSNRIARDWQHELDFSYMTNRSPSHFHSMTNYFPPASGNFETRQDSKGKYKNILLRDRISYTASFGQWQLEPAVSFSYRKAKEDISVTYITYNNGIPSNQSFTGTFLDIESYVLTPAVTLSYGNAFSIGGGVSLKLKEDNTTYEDKAYPYVTTSLDVLRIGRPDNPKSLKIFGSFAKPGNFLDHHYMQSDLVYDMDPILANVRGQAGAGGVLYMPYTGDPTIQHFEAGAVFALPDQKLQISYNYDNRKYLGSLLVPVAVTTGYTWYMYHPDYIYNAHRLGVLARIIDNSGVRWFSGINGTGIKYKLSDRDQYPSFGSTRHGNNDKVLWTGGLTNRFTCKSFSFGFDVLYQLNEYRPGAISEFDRFNTLRLNHIYAGYSFKIAKSNPLEVYLSSRAPLQTTDAEFHDHRRYYGAGFRLQL